MHFLIRENFDQKIQTFNKNTVLKSENLCTIS